LLRFGVLLSGFPPSTTTSRLCVNGSWLIVFSLFCFINKQILKALYSSCYAPLHLRFTYKMLIEALYSSTKFFLANLFFFSISLCSHLEAYLWIKPHQFLSNIGMSTCFWFFLPLLNIPSGQNRRKAVCRSVFCTPSDCFYPNLLFT